MKKVGEINREVNALRRLLLFETVVFSLMKKPDDNLVIGRDWGGFEPIGNVGEEAMRQSNEWRQYK